MSTREQRARTLLENWARHRENAEANLTDLARAYSDSTGKRRMPYELAWEFLDLDVSAVVNVDSRRLLAAVEAAWEMTNDSSALISPHVLRETLVRALTPNEEER